MQIRLKEHSQVLRALTTPVAASSDKEKVKKSFFMWRQVSEGQYCLTPLGILHSLTGLVVVVVPHEESK